jgi:hypothetical protein
MGTPPRPGRLLAVLSHRAVLRAAAVAAGVAARGGTADADALTAMLYTAGSIPCGGRAGLDHDERRIDAVLTRGTAGLTGFRRHRGDYWQAWVTENDRAPGDSATSHAHKVYVSPLPDHLAAAVQAVARAAADGGAHSFKVGGTASGIHRPDKIVLYFDTAVDADAAAHRLAVQLSGLPAHGVPFTGQLGETGMVSRGFDQSGLSWRLLVCRLLGSALARHVDRTEGGDGPGSADAATLAARCLADAGAAGLDTRTFGPSALAERAVLVP